MSELKRNRVLVQIVGDRVQIQQVIVNLLRNACDAMSEIDDRPKELLVRSEQGEDCVRLTVRDTGIGFDRENADRLFQGVLYNEEWRHGHRTVHQSLDC